MGKTIFTSDMHNIDSNDINKAVNSFIKELNIYEGSNGDDVDFYELLQAYIRKPRCRKAINEIVKDPQFN